MISSLPLLIKLGDLLKFGETCEIVNVLSGLLPLPIIGSFKIIRLILSAILKLFYKPTNLTKSLQVTWFCIFSATETKPRTVI